MVKRLLILFGTLAILSAGVVLWYSQRTSETALPSVEEATEATTPVKALSLEEIPFMGELPPSGIDTSDWKTFKNDELAASIRDYGFQVKYPPELVVKLWPGDLDTVGFSTNEPETDAAMAVHVNAGETLGEVIEKIQQKDGDSITTLTKYMFGNMEVIQSETRYPDLDAAYAYIFEKNGLVLSISGFYTRTIGTAMLETLTFNK